MPYINKKSREYYDPKMKEILEVLNSDTPKGDIVYILCMIIIKTIGTKQSFTHLSERINTLIDAWSEAKVQVIRPYEDSKIKLNGNLPWPKIK